MDGETETTAAKVHKAMTEQRPAADEANSVTTAETVEAAATAAGVPDLLRNVGEFPETFL